MVLFYAKPRYALVNPIDAYSSTSGSNHNFGNTRDPAPTSQKANKGKSSSTVTLHETLLHCSYYGFCPA